MKSMSKADAVRDLFLKRIESGVYPEGSLLPPEIELAAELQVSRATVNKALVSLVHQGLLERKPRVGTRVICNNSFALERNGVVLTATYAFVYPGETHPAVWAVVQGFHKAAIAAGRRTLLLGFGFDFEKEEDIVSHISGMNVDAIAVYPLIIDSQQRYRVEQAMLAQQRCPVMLAGTFLQGVSLPSVVPDGFEAAYVMTKYLVERGGRKIGFLNSDELDVNMRDRYMGYRKALQDAGVAEDPQCVIMASEFDPDFTHPLDEVTALARKWMERSGGRADAVLCSHDYLAQGCLIAAKEAGVSVPKDLKIAGIGGNAFIAGSQVDSALTTYKLPYDQIGQETFRRLDLLVSEKDVLGEEGVHLYLKGELVPGQTA